MFTTVLHHSVLKQHCRHLGTEDTCSCRFLKTTAFPFDTQSSNPVPLGVNMTKCSQKHVSFCVVKRLKTTCLRPRQSENAN